MGPIIGELGYVRIPDNPLTRPLGEFVPNFCPKKCFCLILQELCDFSGTWDLRYLILLRMWFCQIFLVQAIFLVFR